MSDGPQVGSAYIRLIPRMDGTKKYVDDELGGVDGSSAGKKAGGGFASAFRGAVGAASGIAAAVGFGSLVAEAGEAADATQKFKSTLSFAGFDGAEIDSLTESVRAYADQTVYDLGDVQSITAQLAANGVSGYDRLAQAAGNLNAVAGGNADTFKSVGMALTQTAGQGKLTTENWNQLADAIPGASGRLQEAMLQNGAYTGNFREAMERGEITADEFNQAIMDLGFEDAAINAANSTSTFEGAFGNLQAEVVGKLSDIVSKVQPYITDAVNAVTEGVGPAFDGVSQAVDFVVEHMDTFKIVADKVAIAVSAAVGALVAYKTAMAISTTIQTVTAAVNAFKTAQNASTIAQAALNAVMNANPFMIVVTVIGALVGAFIYLWTTNEEFRNKIMEIWEAVKTFALEAFGAVCNFFTIDVPNAINSMVQWFSELPARIGGFFSDLVSKAASWVSDMAAKAASAASDFGSNLVNGLLSIPDKVVEIGGQIINGLVNGIKNGAQNVVNAIGDVIGGAVDFAKNILGIASPSKVFASFGDYTMIGFAKGVDRSARFAVSAASGAMGGVVGVSSSAPQLSYEAAASSPRATDAESAARMVIEALPAIISRYTPVVGERDFARMARGAVLRA